VPSAGLHLALCIPPDFSKCAFFRAHFAASLSPGTPQCTELYLQDICASYPPGSARFLRCLCDVCVRFVLFIITVSCNKRANPHSCCGPAGPDDPALHEA
jgi:hypothetical protein